MYLLTVQTGELSQHKTQGDLYFKEVKNPTKLMFRCALKSKPTQCTLMGKSLLKMLAQLRGCSHPLSSGTSSNWQIWAQVHLGIQLSLALLMDVGLGKENFTSMPSLPPKSSAQTHYRLVSHPQQC